MDIITEILTNVYAAKFPIPRTESEAMERLYAVFKELIGNGKIESEVKDGIGEYYRMLRNRELPAYEWLMEAFHVTSKKSDKKRNFPYVVGMIRYWMRFGFGHVPSQEEEDIVDHFEETTGMKVTPGSRTALQHLMGTYGAIKVAAMISNLNNDNDKSFVMTQVLKYTLEKRYLQ